MLVRKFLTEEEEAAAMARGEARGRLEGMVKVFYQRMNLSYREIAQELGLQEKEVLEIVSKLG